MVQTSDRFEIAIVNTTDTPVNFILVRMDYGDVKDIPVVNGVVDATAQVVYESDDPTVQSPPVVAYIMIHPENPGESLPPGWEPASVEAGEELMVNKNETPTSTATTVAATSAYPSRRPVCLAFTKSWKRCFVST